MKIAIAACGYGAGNIGDEAILAGLKYLLLGLDSSAKLSVMSINPSVTKRMHGIESFGWMSYKNPKSIIKYLRNIKDCDLVLFGGATLGDDTYGISYPILSTSLMIIFAKLIRKKTGLISIGVNEFTTGLGRFLVKSIYGGTDFITTRDYPSLSILRSLKIKEGKVFETADAAYALQPISKESALEELIIRGIDTSKKLVGFSVLDEVYQGYDYKEKIASLCDYIIEKYDYTPVFINHEVRVGMDQEATADVLKLIKHREKVRVLSTEFYSPELMAGMLANFELVIGMRMHILILSTIAGTPVIGISRVDKVDNFFQQLGSGTFTHIKKFELEKTIADIDDVVLNRTKRSQEVIAFSKKKKEDFYSRSIKVLSAYIKHP